MEANREYKDSVFRMFFNDEKRLKELYRAVTGQECEEIHSVEIATLKDSIYGNIKNDISFIVNGKLFIFTEHMSTKSPNMPVRMLEYATSSLNIFIDHTKIYSMELQRMPAPEFYVLYNGTRPLKEEEKILKLSDAFLGTPDAECSMELKVKVIDINMDNMDAELQSCRSLKEYATFIGKIRENRARGMELDQAIDDAIEYCIAKEMMVEFLKEYGKKVRSVIFTQLSDEEMMEIRVKDEVRIRMEEITSELTSKITSELTPKITSELTPKITSELTPKITSELTTKITSEVSDKIRNEDEGKLVSVMKELGATRGVAREKLMEQYALTVEEAEDIMERNW